MTWTRKDFEAVAERIVDLYPLEPDQTPEGVHDAGNVARHTAYVQWNATRHALADLCAERGGLNVNGNRKFDRDRFLARTDCVKRDRIVRSLTEGAS